VLARRIGHRAPCRLCEDVVLTQGLAHFTRLDGQPTARLIPAAVLEPRLRLVEGTDVIEGEAFDLEAVLAQNAVPSSSMRASPAMRDKIMASFEFSRFRENRFNAVGDPGVYYAGTTLPAAIHEIKWHLENDEGVPFDATRVYRVVTARTDGRFLDLRGTRARALNPDTTVGYPAGHRVAEEVRDVAQGIIYPSARHPDATCIAVFDPAALRDFRMERLISFEPVPGPERRFGYRIHVQPHQVAAMTAAMQAGRERSYA
jgi:hypothetical protein